MRGCLQLARWLSAAPKGSAASLFQPPFGLSSSVRFFANSASRSARGSTVHKSDLENRIAAIPIDRYRNFCIVAHVDHGKSTLSDRLLELTGTIQPGSNKQVLDKLDVERERGITVKAQTCTMIYNHEGEDYLLHLVDTPGHVDFRAEVSRSYASCGGALLLVDASQGIQAQTVANFYLAFSQGLELIPVINKVDLPSAEPQRALEQMKHSFELDTESAVLVSAKTGLNVEQLLPTVVDKIPAPVGDFTKPLRMLLVDSWYDSYKGVICLVRVFDGEIRAGDQLVSFATGLKYYVGEVGIMYPNETPQTVLRAGQVGYIYFNPGMKRSKEAKIGDTYTKVGSEKLVEPLPGFEEPKSMVFVAAYPVDADHFEHLEDSINQLMLNDRSITVQKESSEALGAGFRLGFLGTLHCSVFEDRLRQEHGASIIITPPSVPVKIVYKDGREEIISNPAKFPDDESARAKVLEFHEPYVTATLTFPDEYLGKVIELCENNRGEQKSLEYFTSTQVILKYELPLAQLVDDFFGKLKGNTKGYASLDYEESAWRPSSIVKLQLLVNKAPVDAVARIVHYSQADRLGRQWVTKFKEHVDRQLFEIIIQAAVGRKVVARETVKPYRKDVLAKLHASDVSRRRKLLEKQKEGRKRLRAVGNVSLSSCHDHHLTTVMQPPEGVQVDLGKAQVIDRVPKVIKELKFGVLSNDDIVSQGVVEVSDRKFFDLEHDRAVVANGPLDARMGISNKTSTCQTCGGALQVCNGHFGHVRLVLPSFHVGYFKRVITILQEICKECSHILLPEADRRAFLREMRRPGLDNLRRMQIAKRINERCKKTRNCEHCGAVNGVVKKAGTSALKITHDKFRAFNASTSVKKVPPPSKIVFDRSFDEARTSNAEVEKHYKKAQDDMNALRVLNLFKKISDTDCELLGLDPKEARPEMFLWQFIPAPPVCIRPSVGQDAASTEDDLTAKLGDIVQSNINLKNALLKGAPVQTIMECWDYMQLQIAVYINSDVPGLNKADLGKPIRGFVQRLKGKQGRFRGNLSGKRVDFSGRTVISPDPNLRVDEVAVPELVAKNMTYPEVVTRYNKEKLQQRVRNGTKKWPGANYITKKGQTFKLFLKYGNLNMIADQLQEGDVIERHIEDGDIVLFNRQPSLHKLSILSHFAKVRPHRTFRLNECVCNPYNADFDGDEMNLHVPQTEEARAEAMELMGVKNNLATPKNGEPIISAIQDFISAAYVLSSKDNFFDRRSFTQICLYMLGPQTRFDLPPPSVLKPQMLWTGKQVFNILMRPNKDDPCLVNLDAACREFKMPKDGRPKDLDPKDGWLVIRNSEVMCGVMDKSTIGSGKKDNVFYIMLRDYGPAAAAEGMNRLSKLSARWFTNMGFSIGITDVYPSEKLLRSKHDLVETAYAACDEVIAKYKAGTLEKYPGCDELQTMENQLSGILSKVRQQAGDECIAQLSKYNSPLIMATSGSKGSSINVSQMVALVGQQIIGGQRVQDGFQDRTLPHFPKNARQPPSKGFVRNSFFSGLTPTEFIFHAMSGREGLVDTAVKTAETGYMSRRLMKSLEDLSTRYDDTVRNSSAAIVQFQYGDDKLDPVDMEGKAKPVHFDRTFIHSESITYSNDEPSLLPAEIMEVCEEMLSKERAKLVRKDLMGNTLAYMDRSDHGIDQFESARDFLESIQQYVATKADKLISRGGDIDPSDERSQKGLNHTGKLTERTLRTFITECLMKYKKAQVEAGHAVGAVGAQSIGEPGTQMTLKTFHFAGVAGMSITQGVPRIKEIINASKEISTPVVACELVTKDNIIAARIVKGRIEQTYLRDIIHYVRETWTGKEAYITVKINWKTIQDLALELKIENILAAIKSHKRFKADDLKFRCSRSHIHVYMDVEPSSKASLSKTEIAHTSADPFLRLKHLKRMLPDIQVLGHPQAYRAIIRTDETSTTNTLLVEGYGLRACMTTMGVDGLRTTTNNIMETREVLGIEAARSTIVQEISEVMKDMDIDPRHMQLLADVMTYKGEVLGITRFGLAKMRDSVLQLASFEKTADHLFDAGGAGRTDLIEGVSECIIMGKTVSLGTGAMEVVRKMNFFEGQIGPRKTTFEDAWTDVYEAPQERARAKRKARA
ncbi:DNA-directed RNA polymerase III core subunit RPO31 [Aspergillus fijiensis CBS 313.89]|uniref:DNA-directed RNA polymerase subunit n=1 Tax=Aspergillus fijiensis CBS 313.89 TaxID=1448319 RepID=A0A8G1RFF5_9EURO|nr:beta and beta-prime subunits of DNA dependent RNA-polymerase [Aspergillus fijiensis CBS 313.89]RAK72832.1 beta and beta-prime subunits of DNA dependent RNA-polymerase [Aspergillus fijiensis CBS 313.89]